MNPDVDVLYGDVFCFFNPQTDTVLNVEGFCEECAYPLEYERVQKAILDWSGALFVIEPKSSFSSRQEFASFVSDNMLALFDRSAEVDGYPSQPHEQALNRKSQMMQRVAFELEASASNYEQHYGQPVKYGDIVQLRHVNSGRYFCSKSSGMGGSTQLAVVDTANADESSLWRFLSKSRLFGSLKYAVETHLSSVAYDALVTVSVGPSGPSTYTMCADVDCMSAFKLVYLGREKSHLTCLCVGDAINILHFSSPKMLTSRYGDYQTFHTVATQSSADAQDELHAPARAYYIVEGAEVFEAIKGKVRSHDLVRLRCVCTGELMALASHVGPQQVR